MLVTGLFICLRSAAKITHKAQALTSHAAKWHVCATIQSAATATAEASEEANPSVVVVAVNNQVHALESDEEEEGSIGEEDELEATKVLHPHAHTISFQKRQALGKTPPNSIKIKKRRPDFNLSVDMELS